MSIRCLRAAVPALCLGVLGASAAHAAPPKGWYVGIAVGANWVDDAPLRSYFNGVFSGNLGDSEMSFDADWAGVANLGYRWSNGWRLELEGGYRTNDGAYIQCGRGGCPEQGVELNEWTAMANVFYDIPLSERFTVSLGLGAGADFPEFSFNRLVVQGTGDDTVFAGQAIAQIAYQFADQWEVYADYRFLMTDDPYFQDLSSAPDEFAFDVRKHTVLIGLRYDLQRDDVAAVVAPPPPPPPPAPAVKQFIVFFGFNKHNLTADAQRVVGEAAQEAKAQGAASILVTGHTDTVGSNRYNQRLSDLRANTVKAELVRLGIGAGMITTSGRGETELMVQTGDGVKVPQNRRATIDLQ